MVCLQFIVRLRPVYWVLTFISSQKYPGAADIEKIAVVTLSISIVYHKP